MKLKGVTVSCLLDSGSQVSTSSEGFFKEHLADIGNNIHPAFEWLKITAANGLDIPYIGYVELDVETMGLTIPERGFLIVKDSANSKNAESWYTLSLTLHFRVRLTHTGERLSTIIIQ